MAYVLVPLLLVLLVPIIRADPDALQDFCVADATSAIHSNGFPCLNPNEAASRHFTTSNLSRPGNASGNPFGLSATLTTPQVLPGINTLGISMVRADFEVGGLAPPHSHPRASEILFVLQGTFNVGFLDTTNRLFSAQIKTGDVFVIPKGLIHFVQNIGKTTATTIAGYNSEASGTSIIPLATFASDPAIPSKVLAKSFKINVPEVAQIRKILGGS